MANWFRMFVMMGFCAILYGCAAEEEVVPRQDVSGTVTFLGEPLKVGSIEFRPQAGGPGASSAGAPILDGAFQVARDKGPIPGKYKVLIVSHDGSQPSAGEFVEPGTRAKPPRELIPAKYNTTSTLTAEIFGDRPNVLKFDLVK